MENYSSTYGSHSKRGGLGQPSEGYQQQTSGQTVIRSDFDSKKLKTTHCQYNTGNWVLFPLGSLGTPTGQSKPIVLQLLHIWCHKECSERSVRHLRSSDRDASQSLAFFRESIKKLPPRWRE
ncbi:hypothetical protein TNCV_285421 [Trichonephila clavipes]|nr:hypothetical protein TNCV_285421 [Trichonephila clavipes]